eukprot:TRINITY_DN7004_c0_g1_i1.p1 TRINITY_DN7004_c0_g1~~TRINITY_DN7004_c0_g1_i1.p1  ORF type:complete len:123 (+),score=18.87 TRINITY_DN7004_c0_g1_i1:474-842(+)
MHIESNNMPDKRVLNKRIPNDEGNSVTARVSTETVNLVFQWNNKLVLLSLLGGNDDSFMLGVDVSELQKGLLSGGRAASGSETEREENALQHINLDFVGSVGVGQTNGRSISLVLFLGVGNS